MPPRARLILGWVLFLAASGVAGLAVHRLYQRARAEIAVQGDRAVQQARSAAEEQIRRATGEARLAIMTELAGFHEDGLANSLQRWDAANPAVLETFLWDAARGAAPGGDWTKAGPTERAELWREFRVWRAAHPAALNRESGPAGRFQVLAYRTLDNSRFPAASLRYQAENLDLLADAKQPVDPWVGWAAMDTAPDAPWIFWYQAGPGALVRGCVVDSAHLVRELQPAISGGDLAVVTLQPLAAPESAGFALPLLPELPGYRLRVEPGIIFQQKAADARLDALIAALLLGLFLLGAAALGFHTWRAARDAGRKITFVTQVSHELRTPLTSIRVFADLLGAPALPEEKRRKFAETIATESARLSDLIERLLAFNALEKGAHRVQAAPFEAAGLVREVAEETAAKLREAGLRPELRLPGGPVTVLSDRSIVKQALLNLLDNACKYAAEGGTVEIAVTAAPGRVTIGVADRGAGIPASIRSRLFEPFVQGSQSLTAKSPGVGLGLSLARGLLRQAGADLVLVPATAGATFEIRLPPAPSP